jgi:2-methylcitrate dehydratase PrpD
LKQPNSDVSASAVSTLEVPASEVSAITQQLSAYIAEAINKPLPQAVMERAKLHLIDTIASMISGSRLPPGQKAIAYAQAIGGTPEASIIGTNILTSATQAALASGMLAHADETDDTHPASDTHPGRNVVPAALAIGERQGSSGTAVLRAMVLGYDLCARVPVALRRQTFKNSGHYVGPFGGVFGAAAASGALLGLDVLQCRYLLSYAAQQAAGLSSVFRDPVHIQKAFVGGGMPAHNGAVAALMVAHGFSGAEDAFAGEGDFLATFSEDPLREEMTRGLGTEFEILKSCVKCWSAGGPIQGPLHVLKDLISQHGLEADQVEKLVARLPPNELTIVNNRDMPNICVQHLLAVMLIDGTMTFETTRDFARMKDPAVLQMRQRVEAIGDPELTDPLRRWRCAMEITLKDGRTLALTTLAAKGSIENPVTREDEEAKATDLMAPVLGQAGAAKLLEAVWNLERMDDIRQLRTFCVK